MKTYLIVILSVFVLSSLSLSQGVKSKNIHFQYVGQLQLDESKGIILAEVADIVTDQERNIYVCDRRDHSVKVFSTDRKYVRTIGKKGKGPGELLNPKNITISQDHKIYVWDSNRRISVFKTDGAFLQSFDVRDFYLNDFCITDSGSSLFCSATPPPSFFAEKIEYTAIHVFNLTTKKWSEIGTLPFMGRTSNGYQLAATTLIENNGQNRLLFATGYPYLIRFYNLTGKVEKTITAPDKIPEPVDVELVPNTHVLLPRADIRRIIPLPDGSFMVAVADMGEKVKQFYLKKISIKDLNLSLHYDFYDRSGNFIQRLPVENVLEMGLIVHCDSKYYVYSYFPEWETPNINVYKIIIG